MSTGFVIYKILATAFTYWMNTVLPGIYNFNTFCFLYTLYVSQYIKVMFLYLVPIP